jgi:hypothetical protein
MEIKQQKETNLAEKNKIKHEHGLVVWCQHKNTTLEERTFFFIFLQVLAAKL